MGTCTSHVEAKTRLTEDEIEAVKESWKRAKHAQIGRKILGTLLEKKPIFAQMYGINEESVMDGTMFSNTMFQLQACRIQNFLDTTVSSLGLCPTASVFAMAKRIGQIHYYKGVNFGTDSYTVFKKVTADEIIEVAEKREHQLIAEAQGEKHMQLAEDIIGPISLYGLWQIISPYYPYETYDPYNGMGQIIESHTDGTRITPYDTNNCNIRLGWNKLMNEIVREMKEGFVQEARAHNKEDDNDP